MKNSSNKKILKIFNNYYIEAQIKYESEFLLFRRIVTLKCCCSCCKRLCVVIIGGRIRIHMTKRNGEKTIAVSNDGATDQTVSVRMDSDSESESESGHNEQPGSFIN